MTRKNEQERFMSYITERQTHESRMAVADFLRKYADRYHNSDFISSDPVQFPHRYHFKADIEISAFLTAFLSFGARPQILKAAERLDSIMNRQPLQYVLSGNWKIDFCGEESFYRTVSKNRMAQLFHWLYTIYDRYESMENALLCETDGTPMQRLCRLFGVSDKAPQKKLNMFLRWMIRRDSEVDNLPPCSITMGVATIMAARKIYLLAWGDDKADIIKKAVEDKVSDTLPASYLQMHNNANVCIDLAAASHLTRIQRPWLVTNCEWNDKLIRSAIVWLCMRVKKPILKLTNKDYNENGLSELLALYGSAYNVNIKIFNDLQHTITGWPGGKPNADDTYRPERAKPFPKRVVVFSPHPDDDVISMGGTLRRLVQQGHEVHVAYETSGNIAVGDEEVVRFMHFINGFNQLFDENSNETIKNKYAEIKKFLAAKKEGDMDSRDILTIKGLIRRGEARTASTYNQIPLNRVHFLDLPFYETGKIEKNPISEADVEIVLQLLRDVKPHQIYVAGDLADPHGTHRVCTDAVLAAIDIEKEAGAEWLKDCRIWMYRGAWAEWEIENIEMAVPFSPEELRAKRNSILKHQSQMESAPFLGNDERLFWQRSEDRNRGTAALYDQLGLACYEAMEAFVEYVPL
jgi:glucosamine-6-phosphate deaminase